MTPENFCYWLQGYFELNNKSEETSVEMQMIKDHLRLVFDKQTPFSQGWQPYQNSLRGEINKNPLLFCSNISC